MAGRVIREIRARVGRIGTANLLLGVLVVILGLEWIAAVAAHRPREEWMRLLYQGSVEEKMLAVQVLSNRFDGSKIDRIMVRDLLSSDDRRLRELAMTSTVTRFGEPVLQREHLDRAADPDERIMSGFFLDFQAGTGKRMGLEDLRLFLETVRTQKPDRSGNQGNEKSLHR
jgi:hypothetical protein